MAHRLASLDGSRRAIQTALIATISSELTGPASRAVAALPVTHGVIRTDWGATALMPGRLTRTSSERMPGFSEPIPRTDNS